jgi:hypothetical protein
MSKIGQIIWYLLSEIISMPLIIEEFPAKDQYYFGLLLKFTLYCAIGF